MMEYANINKYLKKIKKLNRFKEKSCAVTNNLFFLKTKTYLKSVYYTT